MTTENEKTVEKYFQQILGLRARNIQLGLGSFVFINFGKDIEIDENRQKKENPSQTPRC